MHPHEILVAGRSFSVIRIIRIIIVDDLHRCFIGLVDVPLQEFLPEPFNKWLKVLLRAPDDPVSHGLSGNVDTVPIELVLYAVQWVRVHILGVHDSSHKRRCSYTVPHEIFGTVTAKEFILMITFSPDCYINGMCFDSISCRLAADSYVLIGFDPSPAVFAEELIELFIGETVVMCFTGKILEIIITLSFFLFLTGGDNDFLSGRFIRIVSIGLNFVEEVHLAGYLIQPFGVTAKAILVSKTDLLYQMFHVEVHLCDLILQGNDDVHHLFSAEVIKFIRCVFI